MPDSFRPGPNDQEIMKVDIYYDEIPDELLSKYQGGNSAGSSKQPALQQGKLSDPYSSYEHF
jgi:hypothetical protein